MIFKKDRYFSKFISLHALFSFMHLSHRCIWYVLFLSLTSVSYMHNHAHNKSFITFVYAVDWINTVFKKESLRENVWESPWVRKCTRECEREYSRKWGSVRERDADFLNWIRRALYENQNKYSLESRGLNSLSTNQ